MARDDMPPRMKRFLANPPKRISEAMVRQRRSKAMRRSTKLRSMLKDLRKEQGNRCAYCKQMMISKASSSRERPYVATVDHIVPLSAGGTNDRTNLAAACERCNAEKSSMPAEDYRQLWEYRFAARPKWGVR